MKATIIFSGSNERAVISFCRFAISRNLKFYIIANGHDDSIFLTQYKSNVVFIREKNVLKVDVLLDVCELIKERFDFKQYFVLPSTEYLNRFLLLNRSILNKNNVSFGLCNSELYNKISNKYEFGKLCELYEIKTPIEFKFRPKKLPYIVKPKGYFDSENNVSSKPLIIRNKEDEFVFDSLKNKGDYFFQEYVNGKSIYLLFHFSKNGKYSIYSQENFIQQTNGGSMIFALSKNLHKNMDLVSKYIDMFTEEGFSGLVMVEVKEYKNEYYMIEANPRLWGPSQLILDSGMNLFDCFALENELTALAEVDVEYKTNVAYFWSGGLADSDYKCKRFETHNYNVSLFLENYSEYLKNEVYLKNDTIEIYLKENT